MVIINMQTSGWIAVIAFSLLCVLFCCVNQAHGIGCFVCASVNGSEPDCEDTFNNTGNKFYYPSCSGIRKGRMGNFPATECIKMKAKIESTGYSVLVRTCVVDNGETNTETEIGRESHCWFVNRIKYNGQYMHGCVLACNTDGCNLATPGGGKLHPILAFLPATIFLYFLSWNIRKQRFGWT